MSMPAAPQHSSRLPTLLFVVHSWGGGAIRYARELRNFVADSVNVVFAWGKDDRSLYISTHDPEVPEERFDLALGLEPVAARLRALNVQRADLLCTIGLESHIETLLKLLEIPYDVTLLGYELLVERRFFSDDRGRFLGDEAFVQSIQRSGTSSSLLSNASRRIACSRDLALRASRIAPALSFIPARLPERPDPHDILPHIETIKPDESLRVLVLGSLAPHKGFDLICGVARLAQAADARIEITCLGQPRVHPSRQSEASSPYLRILGAFQDDELDPIISWIRPHLAWLPFLVPETHSFALSDVMARRLPVLATGIGAIPERVENRPATWLVPFEEATAECFFRWLVRLFDERLTVRPRSMPISNLPPLSPSFYERSYLSPLGFAQPMAHEAASRIVQTSQPTREVERLGLRLVQDRHDREMKLRQLSEQYERRLSAADHDLRRLLNEVDDCNQKVVEADRNLRRLAAEVEEREQRLREADRGLRQLTAAVEERDLRLLRFEAERGG